MKSLRPQSTFKSRPKSYNYSVVNRPNTKSYKARFTQEPVQPMITNKTYQSEQEETVKQQGYGPQVGERRAFHFNRNTGEIGKTAKSLHDTVGPPVSTQRYNRKVGGSVGTRSFNDTKKLEIQGTRLLQNKKFQLAKDLMEKAIKSLDKDVPSLLFICGEANLNLGFLIIAQ